MSQEKNPGEMPVGSALASLAELFTLAQDELSMIPVIFSRLEMVEKNLKESLELNYELAGRIKVLEESQGGSSMALANLEDRLKQLAESSPADLPRPPRSRRQSQDRASLNGVVSPKRSLSVPTSPRGEDSPQRTLSNRAMREGYQPPRELPTIVSRTSRKPPPPEMVMPGARALSVPNVVAIVSAYEPDKVCAQFKETLGLSYMDEFGCRQLLDTLGDVVVADASGMKMAVPGFGRKELAHLLSVHHAAQKNRWSRNQLAAHNCPTAALEGFLRNCSEAQRLECKRAIAKAIGAFPDTATPSKRSHSLPASVVVKTEQGKSVLRPQSILDGLGISALDARREELIYVFTSRKTGQQYVGVCWGAEQQGQLTVAKKGRHSRQNSWNQVDLAALEDKDHAGVAGSISPRQATEVDGTALDDLGSGVTASHRPAALQAAIVMHYYEAITGHQRKTTNREFNQALRTHHLDDWEFCVVEHLPGCKDLDEHWKFWVSRLSSMWSRRSRSVGGFNTEDPIINESLPKGWDGECDAMLEKFKLVQTRVYSNAHASNGTAPATAVDEMMGHFNELVTMLNRRYLSK